MGYIGAQCQFIIERNVCVGVTRQNSPIHQQYSTMVEAHWAPGEGVALSFDVMGFAQIQNSGCRGSAAAIASAAVRASQT